MKVISLAAMICQGVNRSVNEEFELNDSTAMSLIATGLCREKKDSPPESNENSTVPVVEKKDGQATSDSVPVVETSTGQSVTSASTTLVESPTTGALETNTNVIDSTSDKITEALSPVTAIENHLSQSGLEVTNKSVIESLAANGVAVTSAEVTAVKNRLNSN